MRLTTKKATIYTIDVFNQHHRQTRAFVIDNLIKDKCGIGHDDCPCHSMDEKWQQVDLV